MRKQKYNSKTGKKWTKTEISQMKQMWYIGRCMFINMLIFEYSLAQEEIGSLVWSPINESELRGLNMNNWIET